jgi:hypothetical protein
LWGNKKREKNTRREDLGRGHELLVIQEGLVGTAVRWVPCQKIYPSPVQQMQLSKYARCGALRFALCGCRFVLRFERTSSTLQYGIPTGDDAHITAPGTMVGRTRM